MCVCFFEAIVCSNSSGLICLHSIFYERIWWIFYLSIFHISVGSSWVCLVLCLCQWVYQRHTISTPFKHILFFFIYRMVHPNISKVSDMWLNNSFVVAVAFDVDFLSKCLLSVFRSEAMQTLWQLDVWISPTHKLANIYSMQINHNGKCIDFGSYQRYQKLLKPTGYLKRKTWTNSSYHMVYWIWLPRM